MRSIYLALLATATTAFAEPPTPLADPQDLYKTTIAALKECGMEPSFQMETIETGVLQVSITNGQANIPNEKLEAMADAIAVCALKESYIKKVIVTIKTFKVRLEPKTEGGMNATYTEIPEARVVVQREKPKPKADENPVLRFVIPPAGAPASK